MTSTPDNANAIRNTGYACRVCVAKLIRSTRYAKRKGWPRMEWPGLSFNCPDWPHRRPLM